ncbi:MAG TPA: hypothetical protein V6D17_19790 [Candidatus Obscuribacterales bacterium]
MPEGGTVSRPVQPFISEAAKTGNFSAAVHLFKYSYPEASPTRTIKPALTTRRHLRILKQFASGRAPDVNTHIVVLIAGLM